MDTLWPWLAVAGLGALHGLNPATGWALAAAWGVRARDRGQALRALVPIAFGHVASIALVAGAVVLGVSLNRDGLLAAAGGLLVLAVIAHRSRRARAPAGHAGLALWSFLMSNLHGSGLMLVPALLPICIGTAGGHFASSGPLVPAIAAVGLHTAAMLAVTGAVAAGACQSICRSTGLFPRNPPQASRGRIPGLR